MQQHPSHQDDPTPAATPPPPSAAASDALTQRQMLERRRDRAASLAALYESQFYDNMDVLRERARGFRDASSSAPADAAEFGSVRAWHASRGCASNLPTFEEAEDAIASGVISLPQGQSPSAPPAEATTTKATKLERTAQSIFSRRATARGALACLLGRHAAFYVARPDVSLGRSAGPHEVDVDLASPLGAREGDAAKLSRHQGTIRLHPSGSFYFRNLGQRKVRIDGRAVPPKRRAVLANGALLELPGNFALVFLVNFSVTAALAKQPQHRPPPLFVPSPGEAVRGEGEAGSAGAGAGMGGGGNEGATKPEGPTPEAAAGDGGPGGVAGAS